MNNKSLKAIYWKLFVIRCYSEISATKHSEIEYRLRQMSNCVKVLRFSFDAKEKFAEGLKHTQQLAKHPV
jgi:hypothetical protein